MAGIAAKPLRWEDIKDWPESNKRTELVHGELVMSPSATSKHGRINSRLAGRLFPFVIERALGELFVAPIDTVLAPDVVYQPDLSFIRADRLAIIAETHVDGPPDLVIEIISESNRTHDTVVKFADYARYGVAEYWLVDPRDELISTWRCENGEYALLGRHARGEQLSTRVLDGLGLDPADVF